MFERIEIETKTIREIHQLDGSAMVTRILFREIHGAGAEDVKFVTRKMTSFQRIWNTKRTNARCGEFLSHFILTFPFPLPLNSNPIEYVDIIFLTLNSTHHHFYSICGHRM